MEDDSWKYDVGPEILNGRNVADFIDPEIDERLAELEREEEELEAKFAEEQAAAEMEAEPDLGEEDKQTLRAVRARGPSSSPSTGARSPRGTTRRRSRGP